MILLIFMLPNSIDKFNFLGCNGTLPKGKIFADHGETEIFGSARNHDVTNADNNSVIVIFKLFLGCKFKGIVRTNPKI